MMKKEIQIILSKLKSFENPKVELEQYETPCDLISKIVSELNLMNLIKDKEILEVACGTAKFSIAASFYKPKKIIALDKDKDAIRVAKYNYNIIKEKFDVSIIKFLIADVKEIHFKKKFDLIIMNPPFGIQGKVKDIDFLRFAFNFSNFVVSINPNGRNIKFFKNIAQKHNFKLLKFEKYMFPIKKIFDFHRKKEKKIETLILYFCPASYGI